VDREARAHETVDVVDLGAPDIRGAEVVHDDLDTILLDHEVVSAAIVVERHAVLHPGAATAAYEDAESELRVAFLDEELLETRLSVGG
jgi:protein-L-isoaspartate O-methyltransferase